MSNKDETFCKKYQEYIARNFDFLIKDHDYNLLFLARQGLYQSECVFGMECPGKPKFQFGGETGPYVAVAPSTTKYLLLEGGADHPWIGITGMDDYLSGREASWLGSYGKDRLGWNEELGSLAQKTKRLLPIIFNVFSSEQSILTWRKDYDKWVKMEIKKYLGKNVT